MLSKNKNNLLNLVEIEMNFSIFIYLNSVTKKKAFFFKINLTTLIALNNQTK
jgi:hypothetical protein